MNLIEHKPPAPTSEFAWFPDVDWWEPPNAIRPIYHLANVGPTRKAIAVFDGKYMYYQDTVGY